MKPTTPMILLLAALGTASAESIFLADGGAFECIVQDRHQYPADQSNNEAD